MVYFANQENQEPKDTSSRANKGIRASTKLILYRLESHNPRKKISSIIEEENVIIRKRRIYTLQENYTMV